MKRDRRTAIWVFLAFVALYLAFASGNLADFQVSDEWIMFQTTRAIVEEGRLRPALDERYGGHEAKYGLGQSLAAIPAHLLARGLFGALPEDVSPAVVAIPLARATNALVCAGICTLFFLTALRLGYCRRTALAGMLLLGIATIIAAYSKTFFSEPLAALGLLGAAAALAVPPGEEPPARRWLSAGIWLGLAVLTRMDNVILAPIFLAGLWLSAPSIKLSEALRRSVLFLVPFFLFVLFVLFTNHVRSLGEAGGYSNEGFSTALLTGLYGLLFSPSHGVFWNSPPVLLAVFYMLRFHRRHGPLSFVIGATIAIKLFIFAKWWTWYGGWNWGSRFLVTVVPLAMLWILDPLSRWPELRRTEKALIGLFCIAGVFVQISGLLVATNTFHGDVQFLAGSKVLELTGQPQPLIDREHLLMFGPSLSPIFGNWPIILSGRIDWFGLSLGRYFPPGLLRAILGGLAVVFMIGTVGVLRAWRSSPALEADAVPLLDPAPVKPAPLPPIVRKFALALVVLNIAFLIVITGMMRLNGVRRIDHTIFGGSRATSTTTYRPAGSIYLNDEKIVDPEVTELKTEWRGLIDLPVRGEYIFYTVAHGAFDLLIDGRPILVNRATGGRRSQRVDTPALERGLHEIRLEYSAPVPPPGVGDTQSAERRVPRLMHLYWSIPGGGEYMQVIGRSWLYPSRPGPVRRLVSTLFRLKMGAVLVSLLGFWWIWLWAERRRNRAPSAADT